MEAASTNGIAASKSLSDSARELEEARAAKRKYDEVTVVTGEEDEQNALQVYGKLFTFDKVQGKSKFNRMKIVLKDLSF